MLEMLNFLTVDSRVLFGICIALIFVCGYLSYSIWTFCTRKKENKFLLKLAMYIIVLPMYLFFYVTYLDYGKYRFIFDMCIIFWISAVYVPNFVISVFLKRNREHALVKPFVQS